jgi:murein L,D-transpeptidase YafK
VDIPVRGSGCGDWEKCPDQKKSRDACKEESSKPLFHSNSVAFLRVGSGYNPRMRTGVFTVLAVSLLSVSMPAQSATQIAPHADRVVVLKQERTLELLSQGKVIKSYKVALGGNPVGPKTRQGDHKTPEGTYILDFRNAHSQFYKSIHISYPSAHDNAIAHKNGVSPGGDIFVHGLPNGFGLIGAAHRLKDWTDGCIAVTNEEIDEIWKVVPDGTQIEIRP